MAKLLMLRGLPASGKSSYARTLQKSASGNWVRVNNDELREIFHAGRWSKHNEVLIEIIRETTIKSALFRGDNVVVDNLNLHPKHKEWLQKIAKEHNVTFEIKNFDTPVEECIRRDALREKPVGKKVIMRWYNEYLRKPNETYKPPEGKPRAIICDIDGTLAHMDGRSPYEWHRVGEDELDETVAGIVRHYYARDVNNDSPEPQIILLSGRDEVCRPETELWLKENNVPYDILLMRAKDDNRKDSIIKREIFDAHIKNNYRVMFILDDRDQVIEMWREMGLKVLQVEPGNF